MNAKKLLKGSLMALMLPTMLLSCSDNNNEPNESEKSAEKQAIIAQCVNNVVVPTYKSLADASMDLASVCVFHVHLRLYLGLSKDEGKPHTRKCE